MSRPIGGWHKCPMADAFSHLACQCAAALEKGFGCGGGGARRWFAPDATETARCRYLSTSAKPLCAPDVWRSGVYCMYVCMHGCMHVCMYVCSERMLRFPCRDRTGLSFIYLFFIFIFVHAASAYSVPLGYVPDPDSCKPSAPRAAVRRYDT